MTRARYKNKKRGSESRPSFSYISMHDTKLAQCLASGFLSPWPRGAEVHDHHSRAGRLISEQPSVSQAAVSGASGDLDYGRAVIIEVDPGDRFRSSLLRDSTSVLPLSSITRVCFDSPESLEEFAARISGFADIALGVVRLVCDPSIFPKDQGEVGSADWVAVPKGTADDKKGDSASPPNGPKEILWLDRTAGSLSATLAALALAGKTELIQELSGLTGALGNVEDGSDVPTAVAALLDKGADAEATAAVLRSVTRVIKMTSPGDSLDPGEVVEAVRRGLEVQQAERTSIVSRFLETTPEIIAAHRELPPNAFSDDAGSVTLRALLLFLMQPDADRLSAVWQQADNLGSRVFCLFSSLVGFYSGFASLPIDIKGSAEGALAVPELSISALIRQPVEAEVCTTWDESGGSQWVSLKWCDRELCGVRVAADELLRSCAEAARQSGYEAAFDRGTGQLSIGRDLDGVSRSANVVARKALPVFPRTHGIELVLEAGCRLAKKALRERLNVVNGTALDSAVFATGMAVGRTNTILLHACVLAPPSSETMSSAFRSLAATSARLENECQATKRKPKKVAQK